MRIRSRSVQPTFIPVEAVMARLTYKLDQNTDTPQGPSALGEAIVNYWAATRGRSPHEIAQLREELRQQTSSLFNETHSGEVTLELMEDMPDLVRIAIPQPAPDLSKYRNAEFYEKFGEAIVFGCGKA